MDTFCGRTDIWRNVLTRKPYELSCRKLPSNLAQREDPVNGRENNMEETVKKNRKLLPDDVPNLKIFMYDYLKERARCARSCMPYPAKVDAGGVVRFDGHWLKKTLPLPVLNYLAETEIYQRRATLASLTQDEEVKEKEMESKTKTLLEHLHVLQEKMKIVQKTCSPCEHEARLKCPMKAEEGVYADMVEENPEEVMAQLSEFDDQMIIKEEERKAKPPDPFDKYKPKSLRKKVGTQTDKIKTSKSCTKQSSPEN